MNTVSQIRSESLPVPRLPVRHRNSRIVVNDLRREIDRLRRANGPDSVHCHCHFSEGTAFSPAFDSVPHNQNDDSSDHRVAYGVAPIGRWEMTGETRFQIQILRITLFRQVGNQGSVVDVVG